MRTSTHQSWIQAVLWMMLLALPTRASTEPGFELSQLKIEGISDEGTIRFIEETLGWKPGQTYTEDELYQLMHVLQLSGNYSEIEFLFEDDPGTTNDILVIQLKPTRMISRVHLNESRTVNDEQLKSQISQTLSSFVGKPVSQSEIDRLIRLIYELLQSEGFFQTTAFVNRYVVDDRSEELEVNIEYGQQQRLGAVDIKGHLPYAKADIRKRMRLKEGERIRHQRIRTARAYYLADLLEMGHRHAQVLIEYQEHPNTGDVDVIIDIRPGLAYTVQITGAVHISTKVLHGLFDDILKKNPENGAPELEKAAVRAYAAQGFLEAQVKVRPTTGPHAEVFQVTIEEGPRYELHDVLWEGIPKVLLQDIQAELSGWLDDIQFREESFSALSQSQIAQATFESESRTALQTEDASSVRQTRTPGTWITPRLEEELAKRVLAYIKSRGYLNAEVAPSITIPTRIPGRYTLKIPCQLGPHHRIGTIRIVPENKDERASFHQYVLEQHHLSTGSDLDTLSVERVRSIFLEDLQQSGYAQATVEAIFDRSIPAAVPITFLINAGPRIRIARIFFRGLKRTQQWTIEHLVDFEPEDWLIEEELTAVRRKLLRTGLFSTVRITHTAVYGQEALHDVVISFAERKKFTSEVGGGLSIEDGPRIFFQNETRHILNTPATASTRLQVNYPGATFNLVYQPDAANHPKNRFDDVDPAWAWTNYFEGQAHTGLSWSSLPRLPVNTDFHLNVIGLKEIRPAYNLIRGSIRSGLTFQWFPSWKSSVEVEYEGSRFECPDGNSTDQLGCGSVVSRQLDRTENGSIQQLNIHLSQVFDFRDDPFFSQKGLWVRLNGSFAQGQGSLDQNGGESAQVEPDYVRLDLNTFWFQPVTRKWNAIFNLRGGQIFKIGDLDNFYVPLYKRFYLGGTSSIRGFFQDELLPVDLPSWPAESLLPTEDASSLLTSRTSLGGNSYALLRSEFQYKLNKDMRIANFVDVGALALEFTNLHPKRSAIGFGAGIRYQTPLGPLSLDLGYQLRDGQRVIGSPFSLSRFNIHLGIGYY